MACHLMSFRINSIFISLKNVTDGNVIDIVDHILHIANSSHFWKYNNLDYFVFSSFYQ